jgi:hypothetical protein
MARLVGSDGTCTAAGFNIKFTTWSASFTQAVTDTSAFGDSFAQKRGGLMSGTFSAGGVMQSNASTTTPIPIDTAKINLAPEGVAVVLTADSTNTSTWSGTAVISNFAPSVTNAGESTATIDGEFTGDIAITWDETG